MQSNMLLKQRFKQQLKLSKTSLNTKNDGHFDPKHTDTQTHKTSLTNFIFYKQVKIV